MLDDYIKYAKGMNAREEVIKWINHVLKNKLKKQSLDQSSVEHVIDYLSSSSSPLRLLKMSYEEAISNTEKWVKTQNKKGHSIVESVSDVEKFHEFDDGSKIVKLVSKNAFKREGYLMRHCLSGYSISENQDIYSYRDTKNMPHATIEVRKNDDEIVQIKGKGNGAIHPKYINKILRFFELINKKIRPYDMKNLGYYHIHESLIEFAKKIKTEKEIIVEISGEHYAYKIN